MNNTLLKYCSSLLGIILLISLDSCIDPFRPKLDKEDTEYILVVESLISNEPGSFKVKLSRSLPIDSVAASMPESGAFVLITDDQNGYFEFMETSPGIYNCVVADAKAEPGRRYQLTIVDSGGNEYESDQVMLAETPEIGEIRWEEVKEQVFVEQEIVEQKHLEIYLNTNDPLNKTRFYKWDISETWEVLMPNSITALDGLGNPYETYVMVPDEKKKCWVTESEQNILVKSVDNQTESNVKDFVIKHIAPFEDRLHIRYSIEVRQYSISAFFYDYWSRLKEFNEDIGSLYDKVPLSIYGTINCCNNASKVLGYFNVVEIKKRRIFIDKSEHLVPTVNPYEKCLYVGELTSYPFAGRYYARSSFCADCRFSGTNVKPDFW